MERPNRRAAARRVRKGRVVTASWARIWSERHLTCQAAGPRFQGRRGLAIGGGLADRAHARELAERVEEYLKGTGFGKVGSVGTGEGIAAVAVDGAAFVPQGERPLRAVAYRLDIFFGPSPDAGGVHRAPEFFPVVEVGIEDGFFGPHIGSRGSAILELTVVELELVALAVETADFEVQFCGEVARAFGSGLGHRTDDERGEMCGRGWIAAQRRIFRRQVVRLGVKVQSAFAHNRCGSVPRRTGENKFSVAGISRRGGAGHFRLASGEEANMV